MYRTIAGLVTVLSLAAGAQSALAADLPVKARPAAVVAYSWTGIYGGVHVGYGWGDKDYFDPIAGASAGSHQADGWLGGVQLGANYQVGAWVFGIEGQFSWTDINGSHANPLDLADILGTRVPWLATAAGRLGYAADRTLFYVKGGGAWARDHYSTIDAGALEAFAKHTRGGWMVGAGIEHAFAGPWSAKIEYNYLDLGTRTIDLLDPATGAVASTFDIRQQIHTVTVGLNYRFWGGGGGPVTARY